METIAKLCRERRRLCVPTYRIGRTERWQHDHISTKPCGYCVGPDGSRQGRCGQLHPVHLHALRFQWGLFRACPSALLCRRRVWHGVRTHRLLLSALAAFIETSTAPTVRSEPLCGGARLKVRRIAV